MERTTNVDVDLHHGRRFESLRLAMNHALLKARKDIDLERAIELGYSSSGLQDNNAAIYQKVLHGVLESAHAEISKRMERSFEELELEEKLLRFELAILKERNDREAKAYQQEMERNKAKMAIQSVRQKSQIDPDALIRHRQYQELLENAKVLEADIELQTSQVTALEQELTERTNAVEERLKAVTGHAEAVSKAADLCVAEKP